MHEILYGCTQIWHISSTGLLWEKVLSYETTGHAGTIPVYNRLILTPVGYKVAGKKNSTAVKKNTQHPTILTHPASGSNTANV